MDARVYSFRPARCPDRFIRMNHTTAPNRLHLLTLAAFGLSLAFAAFTTRAADDKKESAAAGGEKIVLFNGKDLAGWKTVDEKGIDKWTVAADVKLDEKDA